MWDEEGSVAYESRRMLELVAHQLELSKEMISSSVPLVPAGCSTFIYSKAFFRSIPHRFRVDYFGAKDCNARFIATKLLPLKFSPEGFSDIHKAIEWFTDFSQGNGEDGEELYRLCPGDCSPQYEVLLSNLADQIVLQASVICGPARDSSDNQYDLSFGYSR